jgi:hypothetical protein
MMMKGVGYVAWAMGHIGGSKAKSFEGSSSKSGGSVRRNTVALENLGFDSIFYKRRRIKCPSEKLF